MSTQLSYFKRCVFFHLRFLIYGFLLFFIFIRVLTAFSAEPAVNEDDISQPKSEPIYLIPDQSDSFLKFGVAITPEQNDNFIDNKFRSAATYNPFDEDDSAMQSADVTTVVRIALDEFDCFSGLNHRVHDLERMMHGYSRKLMLTGELNLDSYKTDPSEYFGKVNLVAELYKTDEPESVSRNKMEFILNQFEINKLTWNMGFKVNSPGLSFKLGIGKALTIQSTVGEEISAGALIKLSI